MTESLTGTEQPNDRAVTALIGGTLLTTFRTAGLTYTPLQIATFVTALQTKGFVVLSGISGTGKSKLAQHLATTLGALDQLNQRGSDQETGRSVQEIEDLPPVFASTPPPFHHASADPLRGEDRAPFSSPSPDSSLLSSEDTILNETHPHVRRVRRVRLNVRDTGRTRGLLYTRKLLRASFPDYQPPPAKVEDIVEVRLGDRSETARHKSRVDLKNDRIVTELFIPDFVQSWLANLPLHREEIEVDVRLDNRNRLAALHFLDDHQPHWVAAGTFAAQAGDEVESVGDEPQREGTRLEIAREPGPISQGHAERGPIPATDNLLFLSVRPDWRDSKSLLGYHNPLTNAYEWTPFLRFLLRAADNFSGAAKHRVAWFVVLDEMNLAHVEYYFADLLSVLESGRDEDGWTREPLRLVSPEDAEGDPPPAELRLPPNLYVVGTVNMDETTHAFSPKVLDRAFTLELTDVDFTNYPVPAEDLGVPPPDDATRRRLLAAFTRGDRFARLDKREVADHVAAHPEVRDRLQRLNESLRPFGLHFGYRVFDEIVAFLAAAEENGLFAGLDQTRPPALVAFDAAVLMKVLPKFHGSRGRLEQPLGRLLGWCRDPDAPDLSTIASSLERATDADSVSAGLAALDYRCPRTAERSIRMLWSLYTDGFAAFG